MTCAYDNHLEVIRQLRDLGAVEITVDGLSVRFADLPPTVAAQAPRTPQELLAGLEVPFEVPSLSEEELDEQFEEILFYSADGNRVEQ